MSVSQEVIGAFMLNTVLIALNDTRVFEAAQDGERSLLVAPRGLPWRGRFRLTLEPVGDHDPAVMAAIEAAERG